MLQLQVVTALRQILPGTFAAMLLVATSLSVFAAEREVMNESASQAQQRLAGDGDLDEDGYGDVSIQDTEATDNRRATKVDAGNALNVLNARQAGEGQQDDAVPDSRRAGDPILDIDITVNQGP